MRTKWTTLILAILLLTSGCSTNQVKNEVKTPGSFAKSSLKPAAFDDNLCKPNEKAVFTFKTKQVGKTVSICVSKSPSYLVYRFGTKTKIELEYPSDITTSWDKFTYSYYLRGGGPENAGLDLNQLLFRNQNYKYEVYEEYSAEDGKTYVGVRVRNLDTNKESNIEGLSATRVGSLVSLKDDSRVKQEPTEDNQEPLSATSKWVGDWSTGKNDDSDSNASLSIKNVDDKKFQFSINATYVSTIVNGNEEEYQNPHVGEIEGIAYIKSPTEADFKSQNLDDYKMVFRLVDKNHIVIEEVNVNTGQDYGMSPEAGVNVRYFGDYSKR